MCLRQHYYYCHKICDIRPPPVDDSDNWCPVTKLRHGQVLPHQLTKLSRNKKTMRVIITIYDLGTTDLMQSELRTANASPAVEQPHTADDMPLTRQAGPSSPNWH